MSTEVKGPHSKPGPDASAALDAAMRADAQGGHGVNPNFDKAMEQALTAVLGRGLGITGEYQLALNQNAWGHAPGAKDKHVEKDDKLEIRKAEIAGELRSQIAGESDPSKRKALEEALLRVLSATSPEALRAATNIANSASAQSGSGMEDAVQEKARLWNEIGKLNKEIDDDLDKLHAAGYLDDKTRDDLRKERMRIDAMAEGEERANAEKAYQARVQHIAEKTKTEAERRGDHATVTTTTRITATSGQATEAVEKVKDIHDRSRPNNTFSSSPDRAQRSNSPQAHAPNSVTPAVSEPKAATPIRTTARKITIDDDDVAPSKSAEAAKAGENPPIPSNVVAGLNGVSNSSETGGTTLPPDKRPKIPGGPTPA